MAQIVIIREVARDLPAPWPT